MSILEVKGVNKRFGGLQALGDVNLSVHENTVHAIIGPSICGRCYEVPFELQQAVIADHPRAFSTTHKATPGLDLPAALIADLVTEGVTYEASSSCTMEDDLYFSHRKHNPTGRFAGVVSL